MFRVGKISIYSGILNFRASKGNENWLEKSTEEREPTFGLSYLEVRKNEGLRNRDSTVCHNRLSIRSISRKLSRNFAETQGCYPGCAGAGLGWSSSARGIAASAKSWRLFTRLLPAGSLCSSPLPRDSKVSQFAGYKVVRNTVQCNIPFITRKAYLVDTKHSKNSFNSACCS